MTTTRLSRLSFPGRGDPLGGALVPAVPDQLPRPERMLADRGVEVDHTTMYRWVQRFAPELEKRTRRHLRPCRGPWHVDETYLRVDGEWRYLYRAVDGTGQTIDFLLSAKRDKQAAKRFFRKALGRDNTRNPREIVTDRLKSYPGALREMKRDGRAVALHPPPAWAVAQQPGRAGSPPDQAPDRADARVSELWDRAADAGRRRGDGDAGQGTGACRARQRHAGAAGPRPSSLRPRGLIGRQRAGTRLQPANATEPSKVTAPPRSSAVRPSTWRRSLCRRRWHRMLRASLAGRARPMEEFPLIARG